MDWCHQRSFLSQHVGANTETHNWTMDNGQEILEHMALKGWLLKSLSSGFGKSVEEEVERLSEQMGLEDTKETAPPKQHAQSLKI